MSSTWATEPFRTCVCTSPECSQLHALHISNTPHVGHGQAVCSADPDNPWYSLQVSKLSLRQAQLHLQECLHRAAGIPSRALNLQAVAGMMIHHHTQCPTLIAGAGGKVGLGALEAGHLQGLPSKAVIMHRLMAGVWSQMSVKKDRTVGVILLCLIFQVAAVSFMHS